MLKEICMHYDFEKNCDTLNYDKVTEMSICKCCGRAFKGFKKEENVQECVDKVIEILETMKILYDPKKITGTETQAFIIDTELMLEKIPDMFNKAVGEFTERDTDSNVNFSDYLDKFTT